MDLEDRDNLMLNFYEGDECDFEDPGSNYQGCGSGSVSVSGSRRAKMTHKVTKVEIFLKVQVFKCWTASFESCMLLL